MKMWIRGLALLLGLTFVTGLENSNVTDDHDWNYRLVWEDNFDFIDPAKWKHDVTAWGGGNGEFQVYIPDEKNSFCTGGVLHLKPTLLKDNINPKTGRPFGEEFVRNGKMDLWHLYGKCTNNANWGCMRDGNNIPPIASAKLITKDRFSFRYGKVEFRAKMPGGDWHWPAVWMMPTKSVYGGWPRSGEIDMVEIIGNKDLKSWDGQSKGQDRVGSACHWGIDASQNRFYKTNRHIYDKSRGYADDFHDYKLEWSENGIKISVDNRPILDVPYPNIDKNPGWKGFYEFGKPWRGNSNPWWGRGKMAPFDQEFYLILNVAVGGTNGFIPDGLRNHGGRYNKPWKNNMSWRDAKNSFYNRRNDWLWTWNYPNDSLEIDYIRVYQKRW